jgi:hypothetical protein
MRTSISDSNACATPDTEPLRPLWARIAKGASVEA